MDVARLQRHFIDFRASLLREGILDEQFAQLEKLADDSSPGFVLEVVSLFFEDSESLLNNLSQALQQHPVNFNKVADHAHQLKGSSASVGAQRVSSVCVGFRSYSDAGNLEG
ncbi:Histidine-containing phosphotransfer protein 3-like protein [Drosera capensis]